MKCPPRRFFWLLFWVGVGLMLGALCMPIVVAPSSRVIRSLMVIKDLQVAIKGFQTEYGRYPLAETGSSQEDLTVDSANSRFLGSLLGDDLQDNPRSISFVDLPMAKAGRGGLVGEKGSFRLLDQWEHPYQVIMDASQDNQVSNPDRRNSDAKIQSEARQWLPSGVAVFSSGVDGVLYTADDITSWRDPPRPPRSTVTLPKLATIIGMVLFVIGIAGILLSRRQPTDPSGAG